MHEKNIRKINEKVEELMGILLKLIEFLVEDVIDKFEQVGIKPNPLTAEEMEKVFDSQIDSFISSTNLFPKLLDHFKDAMECFFILCHQRESTGLKEEATVIVLQLLEKGRYLIGDLMEEMRQMEISHEERKKLKQKFQVPEKEAPKKPGKHKKYKTIGGSQGTELDVVSMINELYSKKFSRPNGRFFTRESKINLWNE